MKKINIYGAIYLPMLFGCSSIADQDAIGPYPSDYQETIKSHVMNSYFDPYTLRSVSVTEPKQGYLTFKQGWLVCLELNAKNRMGAYVGIQRTAYLINRDKVVRVMKEAPLCNDEKLIYIKWPELERMN
jgi:hypothetical protein